MADSPTHAPFAMRARPHVPRERYFDRAFFELEKERLWPRTWQMACRLEEIPEPDDFAEYEICDESVLVVRRQDGSVQAFHGTRRPLWSRLGPRGEPAMAECKVELWGDCVWISMAPDVGPLRDAVGPVAGDGHWQVGWWKEVLLNANWKLVQESLMEAGQPSFRGALFLFPNLFCVFRSESVLAYRVRPYNDDPEWCRLDIWSLTPRPEGSRPVRTELLGRFTRSGEPPDCGAIERRQRRVRARDVEGRRSTACVREVHLELDRWLTGEHQDD